MSKNFDIEKLTVKQICNYIAIVNKLVDEKLIKFNPNKAAVIFNHDKASIFLEKQNVELQQRIDKAIPMLDELEKKIQVILSFKIPITEIKQIKEILKGGNDEKKNR